jgi:hypothetical protein
MSALLACPGKTFLARLWMSALVLLATLGPGIASLFAQIAGPGPLPKDTPEFFLSLKGGAEDRQRIELMGPDADQCVKFEPAGLRITLPAGHPGERPSTGINLALPIRGDFEITVNYEVLQEPTAADTGKTGTRMNLAIQLDTPKWDVAAIVRKVTETKGTVFNSWQSRWNEATGKRQERIDAFPAQASSGRLRLVRTGADIYFLLADGPEKDFVPLQRYLFGAEDVRDVRLVGSTGGPKASLDVRLTDWRIRSESLVGQPAAPPQQPISTKWWKIGGLLGLLLALMVLSVFFYLRFSRAPDSSTQTAIPSSSP